MVRSRWVRSYDVGVRVFWRQPLWAWLIVLVVSLVLGAIVTAVLRVLPFLLVWGGVLWLVWSLLMPWLLVLAEKRGERDDFPGY